MRRARGSVATCAGGAVLAGWTLKHRTTDDLDLFTTSDDAMIASNAALLGAAADIVRDRTPDEIVANKIGALVGRSEIRDLVDLLALERLGYRVEDHLTDAQTKDGGVTPATLAWLLSAIHAPANPQGAEREELEAFIRDLEHRMLGLAKPAK